jgi:hypothetical protein
MTTTHRIGTSVALTLALALAASAAPAGARPFDLNANGSYVPAGLVSLQAPSQPAATPTSTEPRSKIADTGPCSEACSGSGYGARVSRPAATPTSPAPGSDVSSTKGYDLARVPPTVVRTISRDSGFDWGAAGIGAGAALGLMLAATGGTLLLAHRRTQSRAAS